MKRIIFLMVLVLSIGLIFGCKNSTESNSEGQESNAVSKETVNYDGYKGDWKLKVAENEELYLFSSLEVYFGSTGVHISDIINQYIKGTIYSVQGAPGYRQANVAFEGEAQDGKLVTSYEDEAWLYTGNIEMIFSNQQIIANITRDEMETAPLWGIPEGELAFARPIETEIVTLSDDEKSNLEAFLFPLSKNRMKPFNKGELTDERIIDFVGVNLGLGHINTSEFDNRIEEKDAEVIFNETVMSELSKRYFGVDIKEHKSYEMTKYENGFYRVPALGAASEYPFIQIMMKNIKNDEIYYLIVDYIFEYPDEGKSLEYQYLIELQNKDDYIVRSIKEINEPINFEILNQLLKEMQ